MEKQEALKHLREVFKWFQGQTQESLKTLLPEITETEDNKFKQLIRLVLIATEDDQRAFYSTHGVTRKECTDWLEKRAVRDEKNVRKYIASLAGNLHAETDLPYEECVRFAIQLGEDLLGVADGTVESGISDEDLEDFENEKCVRLAAAEMEATKDKKHADEFLKSAGIMDKDGGLAEPYQNDIELGLDRALQIVEAARGNLDGYETDDGVYECDHAAQVISDLLESKVWKPIKWNEEDENMLWTVINSLSDVTCGEERNWLTERLRYLVPEPREWDSNVLPENADDKTINEKLVSLIYWSGTPWSTKDKDQFVAYLEKLGSEKYVPCDGQCENCACFQSGLHFQQEKKLEEDQKPEQYSPLCDTVKDKIREYVANHFVADTVVKTDVKSIVKAMEEGVRLGDESQKPAEWSEEDGTILNSVIRIITQYDDLAHEPTFAGPKWTHPYTKEIAWLNELRTRLLDSLSALEKEDKYRLDMTELEIKQKANDLAEAVRHAYITGALDNAKGDSETFAEHYGCIPEQEDKQLDNECNEHELTADEIRAWNSGYEKGYHVGYANGKNAYLEDGEGDKGTIEELELRIIEDNNGTADAKGVPTNMELMEKVNEIIRYLNGKVGKEGVNDIAPQVVVGAATTDRIGKVLALGFIDFLDKNRREGKMCLSNGECEDIEKAVREQDWKKLDRYMRKYTDKND